LTQKKKWQKGIKMVRVEHQKNVGGRNTKMSGYIRGPLLQKKKWGVPAVNERGARNPKRERPSERRK